jgi:hypothetical protein
MNLFAFVLVMVSIVLGLGVTHLLQGISLVVRHRRTTAVDWVPLTWAATLFLFVASNWWATWDFRDVHWNFPAFFFVMVEPAVLYLAMTLLLPVDAADQHSESFEQVRVPFLSLMIVFQVMTSWDGWLLGTEAFMDPLRWVQVAMIAIFALSASSSRRSVQRVTAIAALLLAIFGTFVLRFLPGAFGPVRG